MPEPNPIFLGYIQLPTDFTLEFDISGILTQIKGIKWRLQKLQYIDFDYNITVELFHKIRKTITPAAELFIPHNSNTNNSGAIKVISLACTSMSFTLTPEIVHQELFSGCKAITNDMASSILIAVKLLKKQDRDKVALLTPYIDQVHQKNLQFLTTNNCNVVLNYNLNLENDYLTSSLSKDYIEEIIERMIKNSTDKIDIFVVGCNAFRVTEYGFISKLEEKYSCFFVTSNQAMIWNSLHLALDNTPKESLIKNIKGYGYLFNK